MKRTGPILETIKIRIDRIADARGIVFSDKLRFVEMSIETMDPGEVLLIYCSDYHHKSEIPKWVTEHGHFILSIIEENQYFKIIIKKGNGNKPHKKTLPNVKFKRNEN